MRLSWTLSRHREWFVSILIAVTVKKILHILGKFCSPHLCVWGSCFLILYPAPPPSPPPPWHTHTHFVTHLFVTHHLSHTTFSHTHNFVTHLFSSCHAPSFFVTHNFVTHNFVTHNFVTHNFVTHHLSPTHTHTPLSHTSQLGVALSDIYLRLAWQAWHLWQWAGSGGALGRRSSPGAPRHFAWQAWHLVTSTFHLRGRRGTWWRRHSICVAGVALVALGWLWWRAWSL